MCCSSCAGKDGGVICTLIYKQNQLYINISSTNSFFPTVPPLQIFSCNTGLKGQPGLSPLPEYQAVRLYAASIHLQPVPCHTLAIYPMSSLIPHSSLMESAVGVSDIFQKIPPNVAGGERLVREIGDFGNNFFNFFLAVTVIIWCN